MKLSSILLQIEKPGFFFIVNAVENILVTHCKYIISRFLYGPLAEGDFTSCIVNTRIVDTSGVDELKTGAATFDLLIKLIC